MGNGINDNANLFMPPKQEDLLSVNADPQQDIMEQPQQNLNIGQLQQNLNMAQPPQDMLVGQPQQVEEKQDLEDKPFNITDFLNEQAWKPPTIEELINEKKAELNKTEKKEDEDVEQEQVSVNKTEEEEAAEAEEEERLKYKAELAKMSLDEYQQAQKQKQQQQQQQEQKKQEQNKKQVREAGKVEFEKGINSRPGRCEKLSQNRKVRNVKKRIKTGVAVTYHTEALLDQLDTGRAKAISDNEAATREMKPISEKRVILEKDQREKQQQKKREKEEKANKNRKGEKLDEPLREEKLKPIQEGFNEAESALIELASFMPISKTSTILSDNPATCALGLKMLVDKAVSYDVNANMVCSVALTKNLAELKEIILHVPMINKLLESNPDATALLDKEKLKMFENVNKMIPDLKTGMEQGLRLNGLDTMGGSYYGNKPNVDLEADKKEAMYQWGQANINLHAMDSERQKDLKSYSESTQESWERHSAYQKQTNTPTIDRFGVDASAATLVNGVKEHREQYNNTIDMIRKSKGLASDKASYLQMIAGTVPLNATQEQIDERVESFKPENAEATVKELVHNFLRIPFSDKLPVAESAQDSGRLNELLQLRVLLRAISALPEHFREFFEDKEYEGQRAEKKAGAKQPAGEKAPKLRDRNRKFRHLLASAQEVVKAIDTQIEFLTQLHNARPDQIDAKEQLKSSAGFKASQDIYKTFVDGITKGDGAAKLKDW